MSPPLNSSHNFPLTAATPKKPADSPIKKELESPLKKEDITPLPSTPGTPAGGLDVEMASLPPPAPVPKETVTFKAGASNPAGLQNLVDFFIRVLKRKDFHGFFAHPPTGEPCFTALLPFLHFLPFKMIDLKNLLTRK